jgi:hypothetical protein
MIEVSSVTGVGQINEGDVLAIEARDGRKFVAVAKQVLSKGTYHEEIVISKRRNDYFIMSMLLDDKSWVKSVTRLPGFTVTAITNTTTPFLRH